MCVGHRIDFTRYCCSAYVGMLIIFSLFSPQTGSRTRYAVLPLSPFWTSHTHNGVNHNYPRLDTRAHCTRCPRVVLSAPPGTRFMNGSHAWLSVCKLMDRNSGTRYDPDCKSCRINTENNVSCSSTRRTIVNGLQSKKELLENLTAHSKCARTKYVQKVPIVPKIGRITLS